MNDDEIPAVVDPNCPPNTIFLIQPSAIHHEPLPEWRWEFEEGDQIDLTVIEGDVSFVRGEE